MIKKHLVSIIIPVYNRENFLTETIESVIAQTYPHWELLLVDDGSTDASIDMAKSFAQENKRIRSIQRNREPKGAPTCRNIGLEKAKGDYVVFLDSDDLMAAHCLNQRAEILSKEEYLDFAAFPSLIFKKKVDDTKKLVNIDTEEKAIYRFLRSDIVWFTPSAMWQKDSIVTLGGFNESLPNNQDHELYLRALLEGFKYKSLLHVKPDIYYRAHADEKIYDMKSPLKMLKGVSLLIASIANSYGHLIKKDKTATSNFSFLLFKTVRTYTRHGEFTVAKELMSIFIKNNLLNFKIYFLVHVYYKLGKLGINKIRGYESIWKIIFREHKFKINWGKYFYKGQL